MREAVMYYTKMEDPLRYKKLEHMVGEELLRVGLRQEFQKELKYEPRGLGGHGKPFFTREPSIHYNISHSGKYVVCVFAQEEIGVDVQEHRKADYARMLRRMVPEGQAEAILSSPDPEKAFYEQWVRREAYIKWTGAGLSQDLRTIPMEKGCCRLLSLEEGYSGAIWSQDPLEVRMVELSSLTF